MEFLNKIKEEHCVLIQLLIDGVINSIDISESEYNTNQKMFDNIIECYSENLDIDTVVDDNRFMLMRNEDHVLQPEYDYKKFINSDNQYSYTLFLTISNTPVCRIEYFQSHNNEQCQQYIKSVREGIFNINTKYNKTYGLQIKSMVKQTKKEEKLIVDTCLFQLGTLTTNTNTETKTNNINCLYI